jgi:hypothetical protein
MTDEVEKVGRIHAYKKGEKKYPISLVPPAVQKEQVA